MTRNEYMYELRKKLQSYPKDFRSEILEAFEGHFEEGLQNGQSEEEVIEDLGSVDEVMENIRMMRMNDEEAPDAKSDFYSSVSGLTDNLRESLSGLSALISDSISSAIKDVNFSSEPAAPSEGFIITDGHPVVVIQGLNGAADVQLESGSRLEYSWEPSFSLFGKSGMDLEVEETDTQITFRCSGAGELTVRIPEEIQEIELSLSAGDVKIDHLKVQSLTGSASSGDWEIDDSYIGSLLITSRAGDISADDSSFGYAQIASTAGDICLCNISGNAVLSSSYGDISIEKHEGSLLRASAKHGDIDAEVSSAEIELTSSYGDIDLVSSGRLEAASCSTDCGDISAVIEDRNYTAHMRTVNGDLSCRRSFAVNRLSENEWIVGGGLAPVTLKTGTGDIDLR